MSIFVDTSDKRNQFVLECLNSAGKNAQVYLENINKIKEGDVVIFSPAKKFLYEEVIGFCPKTIIYCGNIPQEFLEIFISKGVKVNNLLSDEILALKNAKLTAEGVLALIIENTQKSLAELKVLFLGGGRITKASSILFKNLVEFLAVASYNVTDYTLAHYYCDKVYYQQDFVKELSEYDVIVNTRPFCYLTKDMLKGIKENALILETASVECITKEDRNNLNYLLAPALPNRFSCYSAGKIIAEKLLGELND